jgi:hypothetical protein
MNESDTGGLVLYTKHEAAKKLRMKVSWLERRAAERKIPFTMLSGRYMFTEDHLAEIVRIFEQLPAGGRTKESVKRGSAHRRRRRPVQAPRSERDDIAPLVPRPRS